MTIAMSGITVGVPKRKPCWLYRLQMSLQKTLPVLKEVLVELNLGQCPLLVWILV
jgi:hypothetical protein